MQKIITVDYKNIRLSSPPNLFKNHAMTQEGFGYLKKSGISKKNVENYFEKLSPYEEDAIRYCTCYLDNFPKLINCSIINLIYCTLHDPDIDFKDKKIGIYFIYNDKSTPEPTIIIPVDNIRWYLTLTKTSIKTKPLDVLYTIECDLIFKLAKFYYIMLNKTTSHNVINTEQVVKIEQDIIRLLCAFYSINKRAIPLTFFNNIGKDTLSKLNDSITLLSDSYNPNYYHTLYYLNKP